MQDIQVPRSGLQVQPQRSIDTIPISAVHIPNLPRPHRQAHADSETATGHYWKTVACKERSLPLALARMHLPHIPGSRLRSLPLVILRLMLVAELLRPPDSCCSPPYETSGFLLLAD